MSGQLGMAQPRAATSSTRFEDVKALGDKVNFTNSSTSIAFNLLRKGPLQDVRVRKAISMWIDRQAAFIPACRGLSLCHRHGSQEPV